MPIFILYNAVAPIAVFSSLDKVLEYYSEFVGPHDHLSDEEFIDMAEASTEVFLSVRILDEI